MFRFLLVFSLLSTATTFAYSEVYKCDYGNESHYSAAPCDDKYINLDLDDFNTLEVSLEEKFVVPVYPSWTNGWRRIKMISLERFSEETFIPLNITKLNKLTQIDKQILTDLPQSMSLQRFASSTEDIINSICTDARFYPSSIRNNKPADILYAQYACSMRRDTQKGELGYYKIMRGESSIYMVSVKWTVEPFIIEKDNKIKITDDNSYTSKINSAQKYLQHEVKLCNVGSCL